MRIFVIIFSLLMSSSLYAQTPTTYVLLSYDYGNQITRSGLTVLSNGLVMSSRTSQSQTSRLPDQQLPQDVLSKLTTSINLSAVAPQARFDGEPTTMGSSSGTLVGYTADGYASNILLVSRGAKPGDSDTIIFQPRLESLEVVNFVNSKVQNKIPDPVIALCAARLKGTSK
jgi:hypothetical protein